MGEDRSVAIALEGVSKRFGKAEAVRNVTLAIREGEFFSLLGPSGCGKTTTRRVGVPTGPHHPPTPSTSKEPGACSPGGAGANVYLSIVRTRTRV